PTGLSAGTKGCVTGPGRPFLGTATPTLTATVTDPDNDLLNTTFSWGPVGGSVTGSTTQNSVASGSQAIVTVPAGQLSDGHSYFFHVQTTDTIDSSPVSGSCEFTVDTTPPSAPPTVVSTDYPNDQNFHGGAGQTGSFTLGANGVSDVAAYQYGWADPPTTQVAASSLGAAVTITATPGAQGLNTLFVRSVDPAGNLSTITQYTFLAGGPTGPAGQWLADEGSGTTLSDASGNGNTATLSGGTSWTGGRTGGGDHAVTFNGSTGFAETAGPVLHTNQSFSVAAWVRLATTNTGGNWVTAVSQNGSAASSFVLSYNGSNWAFAVHSADSNSPTAYRLAASVPVVAGRWTHLVGVYDAGPQQIQLYVNGVLAGTLANVSPYDSRSTLDIGRARWTSGWRDWFPGDVDDIQVWNRVMYPAEIQAIANPTTPVGQWGFDEGSGSVAADSSGYGHNLAGTGGFTWTSGPTDPGAISLDGSTGAFVASGPVVLTDQSFTVAAWVRLTDASRFRTAVCQQGSSTCVFFLQYDQTDNRWAFTVHTPDQNNPTATRALSPSAPQLGTWTFLTGVYDAGAQVVKLYVNGQLVGTANAPPLWNATGVLSVGQARYNGSLTDPWAGDIDNVSVFLGALSDAQIVTLFNS
ncbi:MAG TPA: LamG domain-containing protein, partial [Candidatus Dormibacteraeota bacterium]